MEVRSIHKYARISPYKAREVAGQCQPDFEAYQSHSHCSIGRNFNRDARNAKSETETGKQGYKETDEARG